MYGCEACDELFGTVSELLDHHEMGILDENFGIKRTDHADPSSALFDTSDFIRRNVGDYWFLSDHKDEKCSFYGAASYEQLAEKGYKITEISKIGKDKYEITVSDKNDHTKKVEIYSGDMEFEQFQIGDLVYIDEDGNMESLMDKDGDR